MDTPMNDITSIFFRLTNEMKSGVSLYAYRYPPDKEWNFDHLYFSNNTCKSIPVQQIGIHFSHNTIDNYKLAKSLEPYLDRKLNDSQVSAFLIPERLLHANIQIILIFVFDGLHAASSHTAIKPPDQIIESLCVQFLKKYINNLVEESNDNIMKLISKLRSPINEIISAPNKPDVVKRSSLSIAVVINDLIDLYKLKKNKFRLQRKEFDFKKFIDGLTEIVEFKIVVDDDVPEVIYADQRRLKQVIMNLTRSDTLMYVSASLCFDTLDKDVDYQIKLEFNLDNVELLSDERLFITKKIISLMNGSLSITDNEARFTIRVFKDCNGFSTTTLKKIKGKKICIMTGQNDQEIIERLLRFGIIIESSPASADLLIVSVSSLEKMISTIQIPYLILVDSTDAPDSRDTTPVNSPRSDPPNTPRTHYRARHVSVSKNNILHYPIDDIELITMILERFN